MATSGTTDFSLDIAEVIEEAYERCGKEVRTAYDMRSARRSLNLLFIEWANKGLNLWTITTGSYTVTEGTGLKVLIPGMADILEVYIRRDGDDYTLTRIGRDEYANLPDKSQEGRPSTYWFDRQLTPELNVWPAPENSTDVVYYTYVRRIEDAGALSNDVDAPWRFYPAMVAGLAYYVAIKKAPDRLVYLKPLYDEALKDAVEEDEDRVSWFIVPGGPR